MSKKVYRFWIAERSQINLPIQKRVENHLLKYQINISDTIKNVNSLILRLPYFPRLQ